MGATTISFNLNGKTTPPDVRKAFSAKCSEAREEQEFKRQQDDEYDGDGYSGDWNTIDRLNILNRVFNTEHEAEQFLSDNTQKGDATAAKYKVVDETKSKRLQTVKINIRALHDELWQKRSSMTPKQIESMRKKIAALDAKRAEYVSALAAKSTKEAWLVLGWASE
jgi:hypothetical protein